MLRNMLVSCLAGALCLTTACRDSIGQFSTADRTAVEQVLADQRDAWNRGDLQGFMAGYERSPNIVFTSMGQVHRGWQDTHDRFHGKYGQDPSGMGTLDFEVVDVRGLGRDGAVVLGRFHLVGRDGRSDGVFSLAFARTPEGWKIVHDHTSSAAIQE